MDTLNNLPPYHMMFAQTQVEIVNQLCKDNPEIAKKILIHNIIYAYTLIKSDEQEKVNQTVEFDTVKNEITIMKLSEKSWEDLLMLMVIYQAKAGIKPTQISSTTSALFDRMKPRLQALQQEQEAKQQSKQVEQK